MTPGMSMLTEAARDISEPRWALEASRRSARRCATALLVIVAVGAALRLALAWWLQGGSLSIWDEREYDLLARNLLLHHELAFEPGTPTSLRPPLYPLMVAGVYGVFGIENHHAVRILQAVLAIVTALLLYALGTRVHTSAAGLWLAAGFSLYPSWLAQTNLLLTETLFTLLLCAACYAVVVFYQEDKLRWLSAAGVLLGLAALTRSVVWLAPPFLALFVVLSWRGSWPRRALAPVLLLAAFAATLAPWSIRNSLLQGTFVAVDTMGGRNFMMGNYQHTPLYRSWDAISITGERSWAHEIITTYPPEARQTQGQMDKLALKQGLTFVADHPWLTLQRSIVKFFDFWGLERELVAGASRRYWGALPEPAILLLAALVCGSYALALWLALYGAIMVGLRDRRLHWFIVAVIAYVCGMHTLVFGHSRYHLPVMPLVLLFAAVAVVHAGDLWRRRHSWAFCCATSLCCVLIAAWAWDFFAGAGAGFLSTMVETAS
jgi:4-amino-4-deoxy-L-arabinose transferase-like glycosyltransferase